jgi:hypothetical protein
MDLTRVHYGESMVVLLAMSKPIRRISIHVVELAERGSRATPDDLIFSHLVEENEACLL